MKFKLTIFITSITKEIEPANGNERMRMRKANGLGWNIQWEITVTSAIGKQTTKKKKEETTAKMYFIKIETRGFTSQVME